jgi:hypothetical protein
MLLESSLENLVVSAFSYFLVSKKQADKLLKAKQPYSYIFILCPVKLAKMAI